MLVLCAALAVFLLGMVMIVVDVMRRNRRRREAESRPIDTSLFQQLSAATEAAEAAKAQAIAAAAAAAADEVIPLAAADEIAHPAAGLATPDMAIAWPVKSFGTAPRMHDIAEPPAPIAEPAPIAASEMPLAATALPAAIVPEPEPEPAPELAPEPVPEPEPVPAPVTAALAPAAYTPAYAQLRPVLVCENFGAGFGSKIVLSDVTFEVLDQGITTLMGPIGTGKSTLLRALAGMLGQSGLFKDWGAVWFQGVPLGPDNRPLLVAQRIQLIQRSALDNLTFHLRDRIAGLPPQEQRDWASQWLTQAGAPDLIAALDRPFIQLDQLGQRIIAILREAAAEPALLLIDEPTNGLAESEASMLLAMLERLAGFTPLLVALQNHKHARRISNQIILLAGGRVQASCGADEFFDAPPNPLVAQFIATGLCSVPAPDASAIVTRPRAEAVMRPRADPDEPPHADPDEPPHADSDTQPHADPDAPPPLTAAALAAIKDEIRSALAVEMTPAPAAAPPAPEALADAPEPIEPVPPSDPVEPVPPIEPTEPDPPPPAPEPEIHPTPEPAPEPAPEIIPHEPGPEIIPHEPEPEIIPHEPGPEIPAPMPEPSPVEPSPVPPTVSAADVPEANVPEADVPEAKLPEADIPEVLSPEEPIPEAPRSDMPAFAQAEPALESAPESAPALEVMPEAQAPESAAPLLEPDFTPAASEPEVSSEPEISPKQDIEPAQEVAPVPEAAPFALAAPPSMDVHPAEAEPAPESLPEPELAIPESLLAEPLAFPITFAPGPAAQPATIDMEPESFNLRPAAAQGFGAEEPGSGEDLPISLNRQMMQDMPLPPRAAATQMRADRAAEQLRQERAAVMRFAGGSSPGPRGFVWIEDGRLAATPMPGITSAIDHDLGLLKDAGITVLITLTEQDFPQDILAQHGLRNLHFPIADRKAPSTAETDVLVNQMHDMLDSGEVLAVHCLAGLGRTGTILAAYMVKEKGVSAQVALNQIRRFNRQFVQTADQEDFLVEYEVQQEQTVLLNRASDGTRLLK